MSETVEQLLSSRRAATNPITSPLILDFGTVMEGRIPLVEIGSPSEFWIHRVHLMNVVDESMSRADEWDGPLQVNIKEFAAPTSTPIPFPSTESL